MSTVLEISCALLFALGLILMIVVYESNQWTQSDTSSVFTQANTMNSGLWEKCISNANSGTETCTEFDSFFLGLPLHLQAARAFTISALVLESGATLLAIFAIAFCPCSSSDDAIRNRVRLIGAVSGALGGASIVGGVSWYATSVMHTYYDAMYLSPETERNAFGTAIFIGWAAGAIALLGSTVTVCMSCTLSRYDNEPKVKAGRKMEFYSTSATQEYV